MFAITGLALMCLAIAGCARTPKDLCQDYVNALNDLRARCGLDDEGPIDVAWSDGRIGCEHTARVGDPQSIVQDCIPWAESATCESLTVVDDEPVYDESCSTRTFQAYE